MTADDKPVGALGVAIEAAEQAQVVCRNEDSFDPAWDRIEGMLDVILRGLHLVQREAKTLDRKQANAASQSRDGERLAAKTNDQGPVASPSAVAQAGVKQGERRLREPL